MAFRATEEKEEGRPSPGRVLIAMTGEGAGEWKSIAAKTNEPMAANAKARHEYFPWDIAFLLLGGKMS
jgi:hypothetical protein